MSKITKTLLVISLITFAAGLAFVTGIIDLGSVSALYVSLPAGAIFFGLFLISKLLEKETALHDEEMQRYRARWLTITTSAPHAKFLSRTRRSQSRQTDERQAPC